MTFQFAQLVRNAVSIVCVFTEATSDKQICYCRGTARRVMVVNSCYVSRRTGVRKVSNSKRDLQGHSRALATVPFDRPHTRFFASEN